MTREVERGSRYIGSQKECKKQTKSSRHDGGHILEKKCLNLYSYHIKEMLGFYHNTLRLPILFNGFDDCFDGVRLGKHPGNI
jgi:hypothetical protein